ncbi:DNA starvation/stationary phase protection protein [Flavobacterium sp. MAH-1]|uniref:DNA starvation/stationary phase protection protein n=1 Tax=Flavobacterium agri TaxID=2743471 RepID=A0A7Y9C402_9FLAO|nr:DNA starvation/stationary phase protection protein [Flavobacterium agri]NUY79636.1 DNA starvation/stationary phase protection protein [Flavobacterium agri]NYA69661.1 DNA starvation/stationary phase protection protein [Flavobacterium agri]
MKTTSIGITAPSKDQVAQKLSHILADEFLLYTKTRNAHWNIEGRDFHAMHIFFESQYKELDAMVDMIAERIRTIGHYAPASLQTFLNLTHLTERIYQENNGEGFMRELLADHETVVIKLRELVDFFSGKLHDQGSADFITGLMERHEKLAWTLRAHLV